MFEALFTATSTSSGFGVGGYLACVGVSLILGIALAFVYMHRSHYTQIGRAHV